MTNERPLRILYAAGPGDVIGTYHHWKAGRDDPTQVAVTYSSQFYDVWKAVGADAFVIAYCDRVDELREERIRIIHRPVPFLERKAFLYHIGQFWYGLRLVLSALRYRADVMVTMGGAAWWTLAPLPWFGIKVIVCHHACMWRVTHPPTGFKKFQWAVNRWFFKRGVTAFLCVSDAVGDQLENFISELTVPVLRFSPTYRREDFEPVANTRPPPPPPFKVFYAGRVEANKGVFDLLEVAKRFAAEGRTDIEFDLCGAGSALEELRRRAQEAGLASRFRCHGHVNKPRMREMYQQAHAAVAPTTSESVEGLNKVVLEAALAARPMVTSPVCPAVEYVKPGIVIVPPDDVRAYGDGILALASDPAFYDQKVRGYARSTERFYDVAYSWGANLRRALELIGAIPQGRAEATTGPEPAQAAAPSGSAV